MMGKQRRWCDRCGEEVETQRIEAGVLWVEWCCACGKQVASQGPEEVLPGTKRHRQRIQAMHTTVALSSLARPDEVGTCDQCGRHRRLITTGTEAYPVRICGTCLHRQERRINTKEMYGHGRRGH